MELKEIVAGIHISAEHLNNLFVQGKHDEAGREIENIRLMLNAEHEQNEAQAKKEDTETATTEELQSTNSQEAVEKEALPSNQ